MEKIEKHISYRLCYTILLLLPFLAMAETKDAGSGNRVLRNIPVKASQGVAVDQKYFYAISNTQIAKCDKETGKVIVTWKADKKSSLYKHFQHLNSGTVIDGKLYGAHSRFPINPNDCTVEVWNVENESLQHTKTIRLPKKHGSLTWIDRRSDNTWWMCYAVYGKDKNKDTKLVKYHYKNNKFIEVECYLFPKEAIAHWGRMSCSGGSWGPDGYLYTTGHDHAVAHVLEINKDNQLSYVRTEKGMGFSGQAIAWDRSSQKPILWGIVKNKQVSLTLIPSARVEGLKELPN